MANVTRRFQYKGPWPLDMKNATDPNMTFPNPGFVVTYDVVYNDSVVDAGSVDERMRHYGCFPEPADTRALSPEPFIGIISPDGKVWKLSINDLGVITTLKVT